ncbi:MAG: flavin reductase family protein [Eubacteriales bacterium]|nr:flavin reductase family protein [Eubacteriales bacterium]
MHAFQTAGTDILEINPFEKIGKDWMLVTAGDEKKANTMTASWGGMGVMWGKDVVFVVIRQTRYTKEFIDAKGAFSLSFPMEQYRKEMKFLGAVSGRDEDKITESGLHVGYDEGIPYIDEANLVLLCRTMSATKLSMQDMLDAGIEGTWYQDGNLHTMYIAEITKVLMR